MTADPDAALHWPTLIFEDGDGDLCRCDCGEQGFDFKQGREWFASHLAATASPGPDVERARRCIVQASIYLANGDLVAAHEELAVATAALAADRETP